MGEHVGIVLYLVSGAIAYSALAGYMLTGRNSRITRTLREDEAYVGVVRTVSALVALGGPFSLVLVMLFTGFFRRGFYV